MPQTIQIPGVGEVEFPDSMDDTQIEMAAGRLASEAIQRPKPFVSTTKGGPRAELSPANVVLESILQQTQMDLRPGDEPLPFPQPSQEFIDRNPLFGSFLQRSSQIAGGLGSRNAIATLPLFTIPFVGPGLALGLGSKGLGTGLGEVFSGPSITQPLGTRESIGGGTAESLANALMIVAGGHQARRPVFEATPEGRLAAELAREPTFGEPTVPRPQRRLGMSLAGALEDPSVKGLVEQALRETSPVGRLRLPGQKRALTEIQELAYPEERVAPPEVKIEVGEPVLRKSLGSWTALQEPLAFSPSVKPGEIPSGQQLALPRQPYLTKEPPPSQEVLPSEQIGDVTGPSAPYRPPRPAPTKEEFIRRKQREAVELGLTAEMPAMEPVQLEVGQYPLEGGPKGTLSRGQRRQILAQQRREAGRSEPTLVDPTKPLSTDPQIAIGRASEFLNDNVARVQEAGGIQIRQLPDETLRSAAGSLEKVIQELEIGRLPTEAEYSLLERVDKELTRRKQQPPPKGFPSEALAKEGPNAPWIRTNKGELSQEGLQPERSEKARGKDLERQQTGQAGPSASTPEGVKGITIPEPKGGGESGSFVLPGPELIRTLSGFKKTATVAGQQLYNRVKNLLHPDELRAYEDSGLRVFLSRPRTPEDVAKWMEENGPRVETKLTEVKVGGLGVKAAQERGSARRGQTGAWFPKGKEGKPFQSGRNFYVDKTKPENVELAKRLLQKGNLSRMLQYSIEAISKGEHPPPVDLSMAKELEKMGFQFRTEDQFKLPPSLRDEKILGYLESKLDALKAEHGPVAAQALQENLSHRSTYGSTGVFPALSDFGKATSKVEGSKGVLQFERPADAERWAYENQEWFGESTPLEVDGSRVSFELKPFLEIAGYDLEPFMLGEALRDFTRGHEQLDALISESDRVMHRQGMEGFYTENPGKLFEDLVVIDKELRKVGWKETSWDPERGFEVETKMPGINIPPPGLKGGEAGAISLEPLRNVGRLVGDVGRTVAGGVRLYSEPILERVGRLGGRVSAQVTREFQRIVSQEKLHYGSLTPTLDPAKEAVGKAYRGGTTWIRGITRVTDHAGTSRTVPAIEGGIAVPPKAQDMVNKLKAANLDIGRLAQRANLNFVPSGKMQRILTVYGVDVIRRGGGPAWEAWTEGLSIANRIPVDHIETFFQRWKDEMDRPGFDVAALDRISQDFIRRFPRAITHVRPGLAWQEVLVSDPFSYLENAAHRTAAAVAFREIYPPNSGALAATRTAVLREMATERSANEFDNAVRAIQGHPLDSFTASWNAPDTPIGASMRMAGQVIGQPVKALVLSGNALVNLGETISGGPAIFLGYRNVLPAMAKLGTLYPQLEMNGAVNRSMQNHAFDPNSPIRSLARQFSTGIRRAFAEQIINELQEAQAAASAKVLADRARAANLSPREMELMVATMRAMGFNQRDAHAASRGQGDALNQFERRAAAFLTSGNITMAERSRLGASRAFNELFWFHTYPQTTLNQLRSTLGNFWESAAARDWPQVRANAELLARQLGGRTFQGAVTMGVLALAYEGAFGVGIRKEEMKDEPFEFTVDAYLAAMGGPMYLMKKTIENTGDASSLQKTVGSLMAPVSVAGELMDASLGSGRYEGRTPFERIGMFVESKTPGYKAVKLGMSVFGLSQHDAKLDASIKAFYRWRRENLGFRQGTIVGSPEEDKVFRAQMLRAVDALRNGKDWRKALSEAGDYEKVSQSLYGRTLLKTPSGSQLSDEQMDALRKHIGNRTVDILIGHDAMLREVARTLSDKKEAVKVEQPTGKLAIDIETQGQRQKHLVKRLAPDVQNFIEEHGLKVPSYQPEFKRTKELLEKPDADLLEEEVARQYEVRIRPWMKSEGFGKLTNEQKQKRISESLELARKQAEAIVLGRRQQRRELAR